jgi:opacity protein-like surface antigen
VHRQRKLHRSSSENRSPKWKFTPTLTVAVTDVGEFTSKVTGLTGWTAGGGIAYKINPAWSLKSEYLHLQFDFGSDRLVAPTDGDGYDTKLVSDK